ncbi:MAG: hypothetical protein CMK59_03900 [Proteobacteria bacterium]|nr:hypothetical protein [Pseudomonadota bacterium]
MNGNIYIKWLLLLSLSGFIWSTMLGVWCTFLFGLINTAVFFCILSTCGYLFLYSPNPLKKRHPLLTTASHTLILICSFYFGFILPMIVFVSLIFVTSLFLGHYCNVGALWSLKAAFGYEPIAPLILKSMDQNSPS